MKPLKFAILTFLLVSMSCKTDLTELNENPNEPCSTNINYLFRYSLKQGVGNYNTDVNLEQWGIMTWMMYLAPRGGVEAGKEYVIPSGKDGFWTEQYADALLNTQEIINLTKDKEDLKNQNAVARIWKVFLIHRLTDLWGDIPYSEALKGYSDLAYAPKFDSQESIYKTMLSELKTCASSIDNTKSFFDTSSDLIYKGNTDGWIRFANSLRLRIATRIKLALPQLYSSEISELSSAELINSNSQSAIFPFNSEKKNPIYEAYISNQAIIQNNPSAYLADLLNNTNDPRISIILSKSPISTVLPWYPAYKGIPNLANPNDAIWTGYNSDGKWGDISRIGSWYLRNETPGVLLSYAEVCWLKAEAALEGTFSGNAQQLFDEGIRAHIKFFEDFGDSTHHIAENDINTYIASQSPVTLEKIITQKWISFVFENGIEAWSEYRRTGFPVLKKYDGTDINNQLFPMRLIYPNSESTLNKQNYLNAISQQGADNEFTKIWWVKNNGNKSAYGSILNKSSLPLEYRYTIY
ncbi:MAG: SusD/RagB family nutrient-binding outer membrane lipoprotein [Bacteroidota bacterium]